LFNNIEIEDVSSPNVKKVGDSVFAPIEESSNTSNISDASNTNVSTEEDINLWDIFQSISRKQFSSVEDARSAFAIWEADLKDRPNQVVNLASLNLEV